MAAAHPASPVPAGRGTRPQPDDPGLGGVRLAHVAADTTPGSDKSEVTVARKPAHRPLANPVVTAELAAMLLTTGMFTVDCEHCGEQAQRSIDTFTSAQGPIRYCSRRCRRRASLARGLAGAINVCAACGGSPQPDTLNHYGVMLCRRHHGVWWLACRGKDYHPGEGEATAAAARHTAAFDGEPAYVYSCPICDGWHVTTRPRPMPDTWENDLAAVARAIKQADVAAHPALTGWRSGQVDIPQN